MVTSPAVARTLTRAQLRGLADPIIGRRVVEEEHNLAAEIQRAARDGRAAIGRTECLRFVLAEFDWVGHVRPRPRAGRAAVPP